MSRLRCGGTASRSLAVLFVAAAGASAQIATERMSVDATGAEGNGASGTRSRSSISADGRYVAFESDASNLAQNDANGSTDIFVHDRITGATVRLSVGTGGVEANDESHWPALSSDGRFLTFESWASNLVQNDTNHLPDIFVHDRDPDGNGIYDEGNGVTIRVSVSSSGIQSNGASRRPAISGDGTLIAFVSDAKNLVSKDLNNVGDIFVYNRTTSTIARVSVDSNGNEANGASGSLHPPAISLDGRYVAFESSATNLVAGDTNKRSDIFVHDRIGGGTERVSVAASGAESDGDSYSPAISDDGAIVAFSSGADNLVSGDGNLRFDIFVRDRTAGVTAVVSVDSTGALGDGDSLSPAVSGDGSVVAFYSDSTTFASGTTGYQVFVHDGATALTTCESVNCAGIAADDVSEDPALSDDGLLVTYRSGGANLIVDDTNLVSDIFVRDRSVPTISASWENYGAGFPGTLGVPGLYCLDDPELGSTLTVIVDDSCTIDSYGLFFVGFDAADVPTNKGGDLLVDSAFTILFAIDQGGIAIDADIADDLTLCGVTIYAQVIEADPGAAKGVSFTPGLKLVVGG